LINNFEVIYFFRSAKMFAQNLIIVLATVLIFAIMNINAENDNKSDKKDGQNRGPRGRPPSGVLALMSLCRQYKIKNFCSNEKFNIELFFIVNCPKAQTAIDAAKTCITGAGAGDAVTAVAAKTGEECFKQLFDMKDSVKSKTDSDKLNQCGDTLKASGGNDLKDCFKAQKPARGPGGPPGSKNQNNQ
jgi:hypothetical protein